MPVLMRADVIGRIAVGKNKNNLLVENIELDDAFAPPSAFLGWT